MHQVNGLIGIRKIYYYTGNDSFKGSTSLMRNFINYEVLALRIVREF